MRKRVFGSRWLRSLRCISFAGYLTSCGTEPIPEWDLASGMDANPSRDPAIIVDDGSQELHLATVGAVLRNLSSSRFSQREIVTPIALVTNGYTFESGVGDRQSSLACVDGGYIPDAGLSDTEADRLLTMVQGLVRELPVRVSLADSLTKDSTKIIVGGMHQDLGCSNDKKVEPAVAVIYDQENLRQDDIAFVFSERMKSASETAIYIASAIGYSVGVDSSIEWAKNHISFFPKEAAEPEYHTSGSVAGLVNLPDRLSQTPGLNAISSVGQYLHDVPSDQLADISGLLPRVNQIVPGGLGAAGNFGGLDGLADLMTVIGMASQAASRQNQGSLDISTLLQAYLDPSQLQASGTNDLASLAVAAGLASSGNPAGAASAIAILSQMFAGATSSAANMRSLPNFGQLLGLSTSNNIGTLLKVTIQQSQVINGNFSGQPAIALRTMLRLGVFQTMGQLMPSPI